MSNVAIIAGAVLWGVISPLWTWWMLRRAWRRIDNANARLRRKQRELDSTVSDANRRQRALEMVTEGMRQAGIEFHIDVQSDRAILTFSTPPCPKCRHRSAGVTQQLN